MIENKNQYQALFRGKVASAILQAKMATKLTHQGVKGSVLEILISQLFRPLLPSDIGVGTGQIIDSFSDNMSPQIDIIIYNKSILPPVLADGSLGLFPIESVLYTIEVKTTLTPSGLAAANNSAKFIFNNFKYRQGIRDNSGLFVHHPILTPRAVVFALNSSMKGSKKTEVERYKEIYINEGYLHAICVAEKEYSYAYGDHWITLRNTENYDEILSFIGGVTNSYREVSDTRGYPCLGHYIVPEEIKASTTPI
ncbi:DUF6602 domain-containing protein [Enterobacter hormaechei]